LDFVNLTALPAKIERLANASNRFFEAVGGFILGLDSRNQSLSAAKAMGEKGRPA
jgi:hypothetical protein